VTLQNNERSEEESQTEEEAEAKRKETKQQLRDLAD